MKLSSRTQKGGGRDGASGGSLRGTDLSQRFQSNLVRKPIVNSAKRQKFPVCEEPIHISGQDKLEKSATQPKRRKDRAKKEVHRERTSIPSARRTRKT